MDDLNWLEWRHGTSRRKRSGGYTLVSYGAILERSCDEAQNGLRSAASARVLAMMTEAAPMTR